MKYFVIFNPASRGGRNRKVSIEITAFLKNTAESYRLEQTTCLEHARVLAEEACTIKAEILIAVGGDGTINKVISGMYHTDGRRRSSTLFAVIYTGTSPDFCKSYGLPYNNPQASLKILQENNIKDISVGRIRYRSGPDRKDEVTGFFACAANIGIGATVARVANSGLRKWLGDWLGTLAGLVQAFFTLKPATLRLISLSEERVLEKVLSLTIGITPCVASGIKVKSPQPMKENQFYVMSVKKMGLHKVPYALNKIYSGKPMVEDKIFNLQIQEFLRVQSDEENTELEFDGDPQGFLPCTVDIARERLSLLGAGK